MLQYLTFALSLIAAAAGCLSAYRLWPRTLKASPPWPVQTLSVKLAVDDTQFLAGIGRARAAAESLKAAL